MSGISVFVRVKPSNCEEKSLVKINSNELEIQCRSIKHKFLFDSVLDQNVSQREVYDTIAKPLLSEALSGYNCTLLAYGQTSSGKTHTIFGGDNSRGIVPRIFEDLSTYLNKEPETKISIKMSYYEIYKEKIIDLLCTRTNKKFLKVGEDPNRGPYVKGLTYINMDNLSEAMTSFRTSYDRRSVCSTNMNERSSRSHCVFTLYITMRKNLKIDSNVVDEIKHSQFNLVDLAGSEVFSDIDQNDISKLRECITINKSLFTLGKVISQLSQIQYKDVTYTPLSKPVQMTPRKMSKHVSYRDSVLTWLLKESLGGNSKTSLIATVNAVPLYSDESLRTLRYAQKAHSIVNTPTVNEDERCRLIKDLIKDVNRLKKELALASSPGSPYQKTISNLKKELDLQKSIIDQLSIQLKMSRYSMQSCSSTNISEEDTESLRENCLGDFNEMTSSFKGFFNNLNRVNEEPETPESRSCRASINISPTIQSSCVKLPKKIPEPPNLSEDDSVFVKPLSPPPLHLLTPHLENTKIDIEVQTEFAHTSSTDVGTCTSDLDKENLYPDEADSQKLKEARILRNKNYAYKVLYQDVCKKNIDLNELNMMQEWEIKELKAKLTRCELELNSSIKCNDQLEYRMSIYQKLLETASETREELLSKSIQNT